MPIYEINYSFDGYGTVKIEAENTKEAEELFKSGFRNATDEWIDNYQINEIDRIYLGLT